MKKDVASPADLPDNRATTLKASPIKAFRGQVSDSDLRLLRVFKTVAEHGGFTAAEIALNKSKSAISLDIANLEQRLGTTLCKRGRSGFALTDEGQMIYRAALQLFDDLQRFRDRVGLATGRLGGQVSLYLVDNIVSIAEAPISGCLGDFSRRNPEVFLRLTAATPRGVEQAIVDGDADLGISVVPRPVASLELEPLFVEETRLYCGQGHPFFAADPAAITIDQVREQRMIELGVTDDPDFAQRLEGCRFGARSANLDARVLMILGGAFLGFLPPHYARPWVEQGRLKEVMPEVFVTANRFYLMLKKSVRPSAAAQALAKSLKDAFARQG